LLVATVLLGQLDNFAVCYFFCICVIRRSSHNFWADVRPAELHCVEHEQWHSGKSPHRVHQIRWVTEKPPI